MGEVWLAQDNNLGEQVALKFLPPEVAADPVALDDLRRETVRSHRLTHSNIIRIHDFHLQPDEVAFISMEYVEGTTLSGWRLQQPNQVFTWEQLAPLVQQLCAALEYAHGEGVIHRDLKPANVMLDRRGRVKLADFGIAAMVSDSVSRMTRGHATSGTPAYMSPQQLTGKRPTAADDIYSLGITLYELLSSKPPFYSGDITYQVLNVLPEPLMERLADEALVNPVPPAVAAMIMACLAKDPARRPLSMRDVAEWIGAGAAREDLAARPPGVRSSGAEPGPEEVLAEQPARSSHAAWEVAAGQGGRIQESDAEARQAGRRRWPVVLACLLLLAGMVGWACAANWGGARTRLLAQWTAWRHSPSAAQKSASDAGLEPSLEPYTNNPAPSEAATALTHDETTNSPPTAITATLTEAPPAHPPPSKSNTASIPAARSDPIPQVPAAFRFGTLSIRTEPANALVKWAPDKYAETEKRTPFTRRFAAGNIPLTIKAAGCAELKTNYFFNPAVSTSLIIELCRSTVPLRGEDWTNSLGMSFRWVDSLSLWACRTETRVGDFRQYVAQNKHDTTGGIYAITAEGSKQVKGSWLAPGFPQTEEHPVVGVNWTDATAFCAWLTRLEREHGGLATDQFYRLPTTNEWFELAGARRFPWGDDPAALAGNYSGPEVAERGWPSTWPVISWHTNEDYPRTAPVFSMGPNSIGLYHMGGNAAEWCAEKVLCGHSWCDGESADPQKDLPPLDYLETRRVQATNPQERNDRSGFRVVIYWGAAGEIN
jgi:hypothetical protein